MPYRATPTPMPATSTSGYAAAAQQYAQAQQTAAAYASTYAQRMPQTLRDDYESERLILLACSSPYES